MCIQSEAQRIRNEQIRRFIIQEIYTTEQTYLDHLNIIKTVSNVSRDRVLAKALSLKHECMSLIHTML